MVTINANTPSSKLGQASTARLRKRSWTSHGRRNEREDDGKSHIGFDEDFDQRGKLDVRNIDTGNTFQQMQWTKGMVIYLSNC